MNSCTTTNGMVANASHSPSSTPLVIPKHSTMRLDRVLDVATRFSGARLRCMQFVSLNYSWVKEISITDDGESLNPAFSVSDRRVMVTTAKHRDVVIG